MPVREWHFTLEDGRHTVVYETSTFGGKRTITVDNVPRVEDAGRAWQMGADIPFRINQHTGAVHVRSGMLRTQYDLSIDGVSVESGRPMVSLLPLPGWAWIFIGACALIPIITLGGAVPAGIGAGGAFGCASVARDPNRAASHRVGICTGIAAGCWGLLLGFLALVAGA
ncbi:MAG TPA: hypothetical protein VF276_11770 [Chloroflexia bacterium]